jgi:nucleoside-diphosphate-sugar epimerase
MPGHFTACDLRDGKSDYDFTAETQSTQSDFHKTFSPRSLRLCGEFLDVNGRIRIMKILVTGGVGKVGQWVVRKLLDSPAHEVTVFDRVPGPERGAVKFLVGDIQDLGQVMEAMADSEAVIHLAAIHNPNIATASVTYQTNVVGTFNVHHPAFRLGIKRVVSASSNAIVGWSYSESFLPDYLPIDEAHPLRPADVYGLSKEIGETIAHSYTRKGLETVMLRPSGVVTPEELEQIKKDGGRRPTGFHAYSYIDARDLAAAFRLAVEQPIPSGTVLFVVADDSTVAEPLCDLYSRVMPSIGDKARSLTGNKGSYSNARAKRLLGWQPLHSWRGD